ncbi:MAG: LuxR C-terminal-related transcriptional regulator [Caldilineaceae bacterium]
MQKNPTPRRVLCYTTDMETPILTTKLYIPTPHEAAISRPALLAKLNRGLSGKLTLVAAPAGFGKSTLVSQWVRSVGRPVTWLTLDEHDNDTTRFLAYVIAALQQVQPSCGAQTLALLRSPQPPPVETLLTTLINELALVPQPFLLVLDDFHLVEADPVHQVVNFLLTYLPPQAHLVIVTRREPPLSLARLRAQGELVALQAPDLRFSPAEVAEFFAKTMDAPLAPEAVAALDDRTEGWVAGLRLAAVVLQSANPAAHPDRFSTLLDNFRGDDRHVFDYLTEEVFDRLAAERQTFLVQTALLQRFSGALCDAVTECHDSQALLEDLARENLFLLPLDNQRQWYRYHPLFADFLRHRLQKLVPEHLHELHRRAARWYGAHGFVEAALDHAFAAQDYDQATHLIETNVLRLALSSESARLARWLRLLPLTLKQRRPLLAFAQAGVALLGSQFVEAQQWVETAEQALALLPAAAPLPLPATTIQGYLDALCCTAMVNLHDSVTAIIAIARRALRHLPADEHFLRGAVALNLGDAYCRQAENRLAADAFAEAVALTQQDSNLVVHLAALGSQGELYAREGDLPQAARIYQQAIAVGQTWGKTTGQSHPTTGKAHAFYANLLYEWNQLDAAERQATAAVDCCKRWGHTQHLVDSYLALVNSTFAQGKVDQATAALTAARLVATTSWHNAQAQGTLTNAARELVETVDQAQLRLWLRQGRLDDATRWLAEHEGAADLALCFARARLALIHNELERATAWLTKIEQSLPRHPYRLGQIKLLLLQAQWRQRQAQPAQALTLLHTALTLAEPGGYLRAFLDEGPAVAELLHTFVQQAGTTKYTQMLLTAFAEAYEATPSATEPAPPQPDSLVEPLSERERDVLRLIAADLTYEAIGETLFISLNTVRTHTKNIYSKLNVNRRNQAIARARALGLL